MPQDQYRDSNKKNANKIERRLHGYRGQWVAIPTTLARHWSELGLKPEDTLLLIGLLSFKMDERPPFPGIDTLAKLINKSHPTIYRHLDDLEETGFLKRHRRPNQSNEYDLSGLIEKIREYEGEPDTSQDVQGQEPERPEDTADHVPLTMNPARRAALKAKFGGTELEPSDATKKQEGATPPPNSGGNLFPRRLPIFDGQPYDFTVLGTPPPPRPPLPPAPPPRSKEDRLRAQFPVIRSIVASELRDKNGERQGSCRVRRFSRYASAPALPERD
ncbi:helix-turn-helix domain-containing protein [Corallococcus sp. CA047B]|uniref:helix-turn-helix domain-containing protein n=1 Tax=Corallococcus sp. CA047B TaxID=2316729 RepID=UPI000EA2E116|nr:helix-turn-helix domain-containing protein [Corallococcus sp. CA047B]RKH00489.1 helix-turn-helix domain-containing protein [Corallococcus sp. CA047B]